MRSPLPYIIWIKQTVVSGLVCWLIGCAPSHTVMMINVPVCDLRASPHTIAQPAIHDPLEETQLLYGERVKVLATQDGWAHIEAIEQPEFTHTKRWQGYPGWIPSTLLSPWTPSSEPTIVVTQKWAPAWLDPSMLAPSRWQFPMGTRLRATDSTRRMRKISLIDGATAWMSPEDVRSLEPLRRLTTAEQREAILRSAARFIGDPYVWGGRSPHDAHRPKYVTGVDCSGLINLTYRSIGIDIPRDAHEQFLRARPITTLQPADLIFLSERDHPKRIVHVMLYAGADEVIEGPGTGQVVRRVSLAQRLGQSVETLRPGTVVDHQTVFFGTYLPSRRH